MQIDLSNMKAEKTKITNDEYTDFCVKLASADMGRIKDRLNNDNVVWLIHGMLGLCTEVGELQDTLKKYLFYGKPIDAVNLKEELGDTLWYTAILIKHLRSSFDEVMQMNVDKLNARYGGTTFTEEKANKRDLDTERKILEGNDEK